MDGEIDIEEHDVLDNPRIKDIFPDLSKVKTEVTEDDDVMIEDHNPCLQIKQELDFIEQPQDYDAICMTRFNNSTHPNVSAARSSVTNKDTSHETEVLPCESDDMSHSENIAQVTENVLSVTAESGRNFTESPIKTNVLKPKPTGPIVKQIFASNSVNLHDKASNASKFYSHIVTGNTDNYNKHKDATDVNAIPNKIVLGSKIVCPKPPQVENKEYLPAVVVLDDWGTILKASTGYCDSCKILFPTKNSLDAHKMTAHSFLVAFTMDKDVVDTDSDSELSHFSGSIQSSVKSNNSNKTIKPKEATRKCVNKRKFSDSDEESINSAKSFREATKTVQDTPKSISYYDDTMSGQQCYHCNKFFIDNTALIKHLYTLLPDKADKSNVTKVIDNSAPNCVFKCQICKETFANDTVAKFHKRFMHPNQTGSIIETCLLNKHTKDNKSNAQVNKLDVQKMKLKKVEDNKTSTVSTNEVPDDNALVVKDLLVKKQKFEYTFIRGVIIIDPPIPISVLFKCRKCDLHFIVAETAYNHGKSCKRILNQYGCKKCKRKFRLNDVQIHERQHLVSESFKVYTIKSDLRKRLLCRCPKCNICFGERAFWEHLRSPCVNKHIYCEKCNLYIHRGTYFKTGHMYCGDPSNIIIDYFDNVQEFKVHRKCIKEAVEEKEKTTYRLWFCEVCKKCSQTDEGSHNCKQKRSVCKHCGLYFSLSSLQRHIGWHSEKQLNLHNFLLLSHQKGKFVQPLMPNYKLCTKCNTLYLISHPTCSTNYKICDFCSKKFDKENYDVHELFHTYNLNGLIRETLDSGGYVGFKSSVYIYQCVRCECFVCNYDNAVRHAQNHVTNSLKMIHCPVCYRTFDSISFKEHRHNVIKFKELKFDYKQLLSDAWFHVFDGLDQIEIGKILRDSVFKDTRSLDLSLVQKGDLDMTLYVCSSCNVMVEKVALEKHVTNKLYCRPYRKYKCDVCDIYFYSPGAMEAHCKLHSSGVKKENFYIISINHNIGTKLIDAKALENCTDGKQINACANIVLRNKRRSEINMHMKREMTNASKSDGHLVIVKLFKCINCKTCVVRNKSVPRHICTINYYNRFCNICRQWFGYASWRFHKLIHKNGPKINVHIKYFKPKRIVYSQRTIKKQLELKDRDNTEEEREELSEKSSEICGSNNNLEGENDIETYDEVNDEVIKPTKDVEQDGRTKVTLYKCNLCKVCILGRKNIIKHKCVSASWRRRFCNICNQFYLCHKFAVHWRLLCSRNKTDAAIKCFTPKTSKYSNTKTPCEDTDNKAEKMEELSEVCGTSNRPKDENVIETDDEVNDEVVKPTKDVEHNGRTKVTLYKCNLCKMCILERKNTIRHKCVSASSRRRFCNICNQFYLCHKFSIHWRLLCSRKTTDAAIKCFTPKTSKYSNTKTPREDRDSKKEKMEELSKVCGPSNSREDENVIETDDEVVKSTKDVDLDRSTKVILYKCTHCKLCILAHRDIIRHKCVIESSRLRFCSICNQLYDSQKFRIHWRLLCSRNRTDVAIKYFTPNISKYSNIKTPCKKASNLKAIGFNERNVEIYKCLHCEACVISRNKLNGHRCVTDDYKRFCNICQQLYPAHHFGRHVQWHINNENINVIVKQFKPDKVTYVLKCNTTLFRGKKRKSNNTDIRWGKKLHSYNKFRNETRRKNISTNDEISESDDDQQNEDIIPDKDLNSTIAKDIEVFRCVNCNICNLSSLQRHVCMSDAYKFYCDICQQSYMFNNWKKHNSIHREYKKINIIVKNYEPNSLKYSESKNSIRSLESLDEDTKTNTTPASSSAEFDEDTAKPHTNKRKLFKNKYKISYSDDEDYKPYNLRKAKKLAQTKVKGEKRQIVYVCSRCDVYYLTPMSYKIHVDIKKHKNIRYRQECCTYCKLRFPIFSLGRHLDIGCPWKNKSGYITVIDLENGTERIHKSVEQDSVIDRSNSPSDNESKLDEAMKPSIDNSCENTNVTDNNNVVDDTNIVFYEDNSLSILDIDPMNSKVNKNDKQNVNTVDNENVVIPKITKTTEDVNTKSNTNNIDMELLDSTNNSNSIDSVYKNKKDVDSNTSAGSVVLEFRKIKDNIDLNSEINDNSEATNMDIIDAVHIAKPPNLDNTTIKDISNDSHQPENIKGIANKEFTRGMIPIVETKLFSCSSCEVYFLKSQCCQEHIADHVKLDAKEYIQCKLCLLQFLIVDLHMHMVTHHGDEFKFENVFVEEFAPNENKPRIFNLKDKLQSLIVSTTCIETE